MIDAAAYEAYEQTTCNPGELQGEKFDFDPAKLKLDVEDDDEDDDEPEPDVVEPAGGDDDDSVSDSDYVAVEGPEKGMVLRFSQVQLY